MNPQAPADDSQAASDLSRVQALLPLHAQGLLEGEPLTFMSQWLENNTMHYPDIKAELAWLGTTANQLKAQSASQRLAAQSQLNEGLEALMERIAANQDKPVEASPQMAVAVTKSKILSDLNQWLNDFLGVGSRGFAMGAAVLVMAQAGVIGALLIDQPAKQTVLSGATPSSATEGTTLLTIAFRPNATEIAIRQTLVSANVQITSGPSAPGLYTVSVANAQLDASIAALRAASNVVESVTR
jgi:hypothetical protein